MALQVAQKQLATLCAASVVLAALASALFGQYFGRTIAMAPQPAQEHLAELRSALVVLAALALAAVE